MSSISQFWASQTASLNREGSDQFYRDKALEHASVLSRVDASAGIIDLGCGAGELLRYLAALVRVDVGLDFSASMLDAAKEKLAEFTDLKLLQADVFQYLPEADAAVWMTTGALNQYLDQRDLRRLLDIFCANENARSLYLFDCVDPLRYGLLRYGVSYRPEHAVLEGRVRRMKAWIRRSMLATRLALGGFSDDVQYLGSPAMGYGQLPRFWLRECGSRGIGVQVVSSRYYEYRYHVCLAKERQGAG